MRERDQLRQQAVLQQEISSLRASNPSPTAQFVSGTSTADRIQLLEEAIQKGEAASNTLKAEIASLEANTKRLTAEKQELIRIQTALTSGLVAAVITAVVAVIGALSNIKRLRVDKDYRRLEVMEKAQALADRGLSLPSDVVSTYLGGIHPQSSNTVATSNVRGAEQIDS